MNSFNREERLMRLMGGAGEPQPQPKVSGLAVVMMIALRVALATGAVVLIDVGLDGDYDLSLWGMVRVALGGLVVIALLTSAIAETIAQRLSQ